MIRNLKTLGVALVAVLALSAVAVSAASAEGEYTAASYPTTVTAHSPLGNDVFTTEAGSWECTVDYHGTLNEASSHLTLEATITGCKAFGFASATVNMEGCKTTFETPKAIGTHESAGQPVNHTWTVPVEESCPAGKSTRIIAGNCEISVGTQTPGGHAIFEATTKTPASPDDLDFRKTLTGINYTVLKDGFLCPFAGTGAKTGGTYTQASAITLASTNGKSITIS